MLNRLIICGVIVIVTVLALVFFPSSQEQPVPNNLGKAITAVMEQEKVETTAVCLSQEATGDIMLVSKDGPTGDYYATRAKEVSPGKYQLIGEPVPIVGTPVRIGTRTGH